MKLPLNLYNMLNSRFKSEKEKESNSNSNSNSVVKEILSVEKSSNSNNINNDLNLNETKKQSTNIDSNILIKSNISNSQVQTNIQNKDNTNIIELNFQDKQILRKQLFILLDEIVKEIKVEKEYESTLNTLFNIIKKIVDNPKNLEFQKINRNVKTYTSKISPFKAAEVFLIKVGFKIDSGFLYIDTPNFVNLDNVLFYFESFLKSKSM